MDIEEKEVWERLNNESGTAFAAFECFLSLPGDARTVIAAYRRHTGNPDAVKPSDTWSRWSSEFAWRERAAAYDDHLANVRRKAHERVIEQEAERMASAAEKDYFKLQEITTVSYDRVYEWFDSQDWDETRLRASDAMNFLKMFADITFRQMELEASKEKDEYEWTEEDDAALSDIVEAIDAEGAGDVPEEGSEESEEDSDNGEDDHG